MNYQNLPFELEDNGRPFICNSVVNSLIINYAYLMAAFLEIISKCLATTVEKVKHPSDKCNYNQNS